MPENIPSNIPTPDAVGSLLAAGGAIAELIHSDYGGLPFVVVPEKYKIEKLAVLPACVSQEVKLTDVESFVAYVNRFITPGTVLFARVTDAGCAITAHLDYHGASKLPALVQAVEWSTHRAALVCQATAEWTLWMEHNGPEQKKDQTAFAMFLESNERLLVEPSGADLLELITTLEGKSEVRFNSAVRLNNGKAKLEYEEDVDLRGSTGTRQGNVEVPGVLTLALAPFEGMEPVPVRARLRYRIDGRKLSFWYETISPHIVVRDAAKAVLDGVRAQVKAPVLMSL